MMFKNLKYTEDAQSILLSVNHLDVWWWVLDSAINLRQKFVLPSFIRPDRRPGAWLDEYGEKVILKDFGHPETHLMGIIDGVSKKYNSSFKETLNIIWSQYILHNNIKLQTSQIQKQIKEFQFELQYIPRFSGDFPVWTFADKKYWSEYGISTSQLEYEKIHPVYKIFCNSKNSPRSLRSFFPHGLCYAVNLGDRKKIYQPHNRICKFLTDADERTIGGNTPITDKSLIVVNKWVKDHMVVSNLGYQSRYILSEGIFLPVDFIDFLADFDRVIWAMDNDETGQKAAKRFTNQFKQLTGKDSETLIIPDYPVKSKDPSDVVKNYGYSELRKLFLR